MATTFPTAADPARDFERAYRRLRAARRLQSALFVALFLAAIVVAGWIGEVSPSRFAEGLPRLTNYMHDIAPSLSWRSLGADLAEWFWGWRRWIEALLDTLLIAYLGTLLGTLGALSLCFSASRNLVRSRVLYFVSRRVLELARTVPELVYALIFVFAFGIGPMAGVLAVAIHSAGALGKLFAEASENADMKPVEGLSACGADWFATVRYAVVPQVLPNFLSYALLRFEINVRSSTVIGFVGAGGIGEYLMLSIRQFQYSDVSAILVMILVTVAVIDIATEKLRHRFIGRENLI